MIDFHSHYYEAHWFSALPQGQNVFTRAWPLLSNIDAQLAAMDVAGIDAKVLSVPAALLLSPGESVPIALMQRINDRMADLVAAYPGRLLAMATIDAFGGDVAAREVERAVRELGIRGIVVDCAQGDRYLDAPEARPVLEASAALGVVVFVHPVYPPWLTGRLERLGHTGILLARGTETAASLLALLRSGTLDELPNLNIALPMIGTAFFLFAGMADLEHEEGWRGTTRPSIARRRLYVDTMGFDPAAIRFAVELLGAEHVLLGSDWPIMPIMPRQRVEETLAPLELTVDQRDAILGGNTLRLLTVTFH